MGWIEHGGEGKILFLSGPAGSGKTAIAGTIADECHSRGWLAGSFFFSAFSSIPERRSKRALVPTLTYHLLHQATILLLKESILSSIDADKSVFEKNLVQQIRLLILGPVQHLGRAVDKRKWPKVIIVDGLDECDADVGREYDTEGERRKSQEDNHSEVLSALWAAAADPAFPFRIIVASRPERSIQSFFSKPNVKAAAKIMFLDDNYDPTTDIETFLRASLIRIGLDNHLGEDWFSPGVPRLLAQEASGQFIYATTIIRFIGVSNIPPIHQLRCVLEWHRSRPDSPNPFAKLDALYLAILNTSRDAILAAKWLRTIEYLDYPDPWFVRALLESSPSETEFILGGLQSLVGLEDASGGPSFHFYHKSLLDCLGDSNRSAELYVDDEDLKVFLQERYYQILKDRGPQRELRRSKITLGAFFNFYQGNSVGHFDPSRGYTDSDVDWWISLSSYCGSTCDHHHFSEMRESMHAKVGVKWNNPFKLSLLQRLRWLTYGPVSLASLPSILQNLEKKVFRVTANRTAQNATAPV
ncbi:hypothetical protein FA13DRAFT_83211 [Coprinellus micaceus]|uniref:Nephrocystin 3-like N-terminal domain-containing protein n=1 Tax=Coprinellus micaceus TaxID=71717 RepID=A0A4Y7TJL8_COPMI|nr:hypothetical protein FA13DRAFT_83211 [Coprinellus micaceus]